MQEPKKPTKPVAPKAPEKYIKNTRKIYYSDYYGSDLSVAEIVEYFRSQGVTNLEDIYIYYYHDQDDYSNNFEIFANVVDTETINPYYEKQLKKYNASMEKFKEKLAKYDEAVKAYPKLKKEYEEWKRKSIIDKLVQDLKKLGVNPYEELV